MKLLFVITYDFISNILCKKPIEVTQNKEIINLLKMKRKA